METSFLDLIRECFKNKHILCFILAPIAIVIPLVPPSISLYLLLKRKEEKNVVYNIIGFLYGLFAMESISIAGLAYEFKNTDYILLCIGIITGIIYSISFIVDFMLKFPSFKTSWKISRLIFGLVLCILSIMVSSIDYDEYCLMCYTTLTLICICIVFMGAILFITYNTLSREIIPYSFYVSTTAVFGIWNAIGWDIILSNGMKSTIISISFMTVLMVSFIFLVGYCIIYFLIEKKDDVSNHSLSNLTVEEGFGDNLKATDTFKY